MKRRVLLSIAALGICTLAVASANAGDPWPADLATAIETYDRATVSNDTTTLANLVADDYVLVNSDSSLQDKQSYLEDFKVPGFKLDPYELQQPVRKAWGDAALLAGVVHLSWTLKGEHQSRLLRIAHVWTRRDGHWRIAYTQLTRIPEH
ncbi:MAG TPA: nuclear transport factor 2 family protein [Steroidobacteraceae bacterium]|jgi:ketosteroid isomerase-like protein